jgi:hypothetical protein
MHTQGHKFLSQMYHSKTPITDDSGGAWDAALHTPRTWPPRAFAQGRARASKALLCSPSSDIAVQMIHLVSLRAGIKHQTSSALVCKSTLTCRKRAKKKVSTYSVGVGSSFLKRPFITGGDPLELRFKFGHQPLLRMRSWNMAYEDSRCAVNIGIQNTLR